MERIKQAVERARQQAATRAEVDPPPPAGAEASDSEVADISYSRTPIVQLDRAHLRKNRIIAYDKADLRGVCFDVLRTQVLQKMEEKGWRTLAVVSPEPECGKTVVAINLAMSIAHYEDMTAMLVDFDLRRPKVASYLGIRPGKSLNDVLEGGIELSEALLNPGLPKLVVLPAAKPFHKPAETLASREVSALVSDLRDRYQKRIVIFDLPPILHSDDAMTLLPLVDCALMVVGNGMVSKAEMAESLHHVNPACLLGVVLNKAEGRERNYYY